ncbi:hypothetical protein GGU11DRAFT_761320, partial [Lentinula aff. detonsa]
MAPSSAETLKALLNPKPQPSKEPLNEAGNHSMIIWDLLHEAILLAVGLAIFQHGFAPSDKQLVTGRFGHMRGKVKDTAQELVPSIYGSYQIPVENNACKNFIANLLNKMNYIFPRTNVLDSTTIFAVLKEWSEGLDQCKNQDFVSADFSDEYELYMMFLQTKILKDDGTGKAVQPERITIEVPDEVPSVGKVAVTQGGTRKGYTVLG